jgi:hypothetical protein
MIFVFLAIKPYKDDTVNIFGVINEGILTVIGFYLFFFIDETQRPSNVRFYAWLVIALVILMVVGNIVFIFVIKVKDLYLQILENKRINRLKWISEVEQKYLFFDYRKFFGPNIGNSRNLLI